MKLGIYLPAFGAATLDAAEHARHAEQSGLESVWVGDHLIPKGRAFLDSTLVLAHAAAVTQRIRLGFGIMVLALRPVAWAAKQIASLQHLSGDRVLLGVGTGGEPHGDAAWRAVGVPFAERGKRTDDALKALPGLVLGEPTVVAGGEVTLSPGAVMPPVVIAGGLKVLRRVARFGDAWFPIASSPREIVDGVKRLGELAAEYGRPVPEVTVNISMALGDVPASVIDARVTALTGYGISEAEARNWLLVGGRAQAAETIAELADIGVSRVIGMPFTEDRFAQAESLASLSG
nr:LLM class flavin-dependent oxidoreductase [Kibdelosporangium sp. MJ126-NF4]CEL14409.1 Hydride transferase 1 [Kibdelosporangium sp. MJ126-NF4]CTQ88774.1 Hydride transferase 1 [Kibdelosporangium sp. MJ126-NF4]